MKTNQFLFAALAAAFLSVSSFSAAQVTIGGGDAPKAGTILDLNSTTKGGLALSHISIVSLEHIPDVFGGVTIPTGDRDENTGLTGAVVYNTNPDYGFGVFVWDGYKWQPVGEPYVPYTIIPAPTCLPTLPDLRMTVYNLGVDAAKLNADYPGLSPAKQQIAYQANNTLIETDATVLGDLYQWGRMRDGHEKRNSSTYPGPLTLPDEVDDNGQPKAGKGQGQFILVPEDGVNDWYKPRNNTLWGNGQVAGYNFGSADGGAVPGSGGYYQKPVKTVNDPCPLGWRIPTQDEWERLLNYGCGAPQIAIGDSVSIASSEYYKSLSSLTNGITNAPLTWVRIKEGKAFAGTLATGYQSGYAIYETDVWTAAAIGYKDGTNNLYDPAAPEPILFLPINGFHNRVTGMLDNIGNTGHYWSSTVSNASTYYPTIQRYELFSVLTGSRAYGFGVRCVKE